MYLWIKSLHIVAVISWMAGILYLYRLLIYHVENIKKSEDNHKLLCVMEYRLYRYITVPALMITWIAGIVMVLLNQSLIQSHWFHVKLLMVVLLTVVTVKAKIIYANLKEKREPYPSSRSIRYWNEVPTVLMILIVIMVVVRPF